MDTNEDLGAVAAREIANHELNAAIARGFDEPAYRRLAADGEVRLVRLSTPSVMREHQSIDLKHFVNDELCAPWQDIAAPSMQHVIRVVPDETLADDEFRFAGDNTVHRLDGSSRLLHVATPDGVVTVEADMDEESLALLCGVDPQLVARRGTAYWLRDEARSYNRELVDCHGIDGRFSVSLTPHAHNSEWEDGDGTIDEDECTLQLQFDGIVIDEWNQLRLPRDHEQTVSECRAYTRVIEAVERDARMSGREEVRAQMRSVLGGR